MDTAENKLDWLSATLMLLGVSMYFWGTAMNMVVVVANNGSMPIIEVVASSVISDHDEKARHVTTSEHSKFVLLGDRIQVDFPDVHVMWEPFLGIADKWAELTDYPPDGGTNMVSVGDLTRWIGSALFLFMIPILLVRIPFRLAQDGIRFHR